MVKKTGILGLVLSLIGLVCGILSILLIWGTLVFSVIFYILLLICTIAGIVFSAIGIKRHDSRGFGIGGVILGSFGILLGIICTYMIIAVAIINWATSSPFVTVMPY